MLNKYVIEIIKRYAASEKQTRYSGDAYEAGVEDGYIELARILMENLDTIEQENGDKILQRPKS